MLNQRDACGFNLATDLPSSFALRICSLMLVDTDRVKQHAGSRHAGHDVSSSDSARHANSRRGPASGGILAAASPRRQASGGACLLLRCTIGTIDTPWWRRVRRYLCRCFVRSGGGWCGQIGEGTDRLLWLLLCLVWRRC